MDFSPIYDFSNIYHSMFNHLIIFLMKVPNGVEENSNFYSKTKWSWKWVINLTFQPKINYFIKWNFLNRPLKEISGMM